MKTLELAETTLERCVKEAGSESVLVIKNGEPLALVSGVEGLDAEQIELGTSAEFWKLIEESSPTENHSVGGTEKASGQTPRLNSCRREN